MKSFDVLMFATYNCELFCFCFYFILFYIGLNFVVLSVMIVLQMEPRRFHSWILRNCHINIFLSSCNTETPTHIFELGKKEHCFIQYKTLTLVTGSKTEQDIHSLKCPLAVSQCHKTWDTYVTHSKVMKPFNINNMLPGQHCSDWLRIYKQVCCGWDVRSACIVFYYTIMPKAAVWPTYSQ